MPTFTKRESERVMSSFDFFGINHYQSLSVQDDQNSMDADQRDFFGDMSAKLLSMVSHYVSISQKSFSFRCSGYGLDFYLCVETMIRRTLIPKK